MHAGFKEANACKSVQFYQSGGVANITKLAISILQNLVTSLGIFANFPKSSSWYYSKWSDVPIAYFPY